MWPLLQWASALACPHTVFIWRKSNYTKNRLYVFTLFISHILSCLYTLLVCVNCYSSLLIIVWEQCNKCYSILFYSILFYSILFYSILFYSILILFYSILFYSILFYSILFYSILFYSILFYSILFYSILFYSILFYSIIILFYSILILFYSIIILFYSILFYTIILYSILLYSILHACVLVIINHMKEDIRFRNAVVDIRTNCVDAKFSLIMNRNHITTDNDLLHFSYKNPCKAGRCRYIIQMSI